MLDIEKQTLQDKQEHSELLSDAESSVDEDECLSDSTTDSEGEMAKYGRKIRTEAMHTIREEHSFISGARIDIKKEEVEVVQRQPSRYTSGTLLFYTIKFIHIILQ